MKNMLSKKQMWWYRLTSGDMDNILKEIKSYLNAELVWLKNTKKSYFEKWLKTDNLWLGFYKFNNN
jgi:Holliday junction resolvase RusA-like endonuclease